MGFNTSLQSFHPLWEIPGKWRFIAGKILCKWVFGCRMLMVSYLKPFPHTKVCSEYGRVEQPQVLSHCSYLFISLLPKNSKIEKMAFPFK